MRVHRDVKGDDNAGSRHLGESICRIERTIWYIKKKRRSGVNNDGVSVQAEEALTANTNTWVCIYLFILAEADKMRFDALQRMAVKR
jgi:hypothetical protein